MKSWIQKMLSEGDGSPSTKRVLFSITVAVGLVVFVVSFVQRGLTTENISFFTTITVATGGAYIGGRFAESGDKPSTP